ncbi:MAG: Nif3-like dinuclear metal center hexameric protein [Sumerlaeia bacterium]
MKQLHPTVSDVLGAVNRIAPPVLAESWDQIGLQIGNPNSRTGKLLIALEISEAVIREAIEHGMSCIVTHHPLIFGSLKSIVPTNPVGRFITELVQANIALIAAHTNLDSVSNGTNGVLADALQLGNTKPLFPNHSANSKNYKFCFFVPVENVPAMIEAINGAGAGVIGNYTHCTFRTPGTGTFKPGANSTPYSGKVGELEEATNEVRVETVCPEGNLPKLVEAVKEAHPYEEVAFDVYPMIDANEPKFGLGLIAKLDQKITLGELADQCRQVFPVKHLGIVGEPELEVKRLAICSGAGGEVVRRWRPGFADAVLTGEMTHHQAAELRDRGAGAILLGHFASEVIVAPRLASLLGKELEAKGFSAEIIVASQEKDPIRLI